MFQAISLWELSSEPRQDLVGIAGRFPKHRTVFCMVVDRPFPGLTLGRLAEAGDEAGLERFVMLLMDVCDAFGYADVLATLEDELRALASTAESTQMASCLRRMVRVVTGEAAAMAAAALTVSERVLAVVRARGPIQSGKVALRCGVSASAASIHLRRLVDAGLVYLLDSLDETDRRQRWYAATPHSDTEEPAPQAHYQAFRRSASTF